MPERIQSGPAASTERAVARLHGWGPGERSSVWRPHLPVDCEPLEKRAEESVAPGRLGERAAIPQQRRDSRLTARRMVAIDEVAKRVERDVLGERHAERELPRADGENAASLVMREAE